MAALSFERPDRVPVVPQAFLVACRTAGFTIGQINRSGKLIARTHIESQKKFGYDGVVVDVDDASLAEACGAKVIFRNDEVAVVDESNPLIKDLKQVRDLNVPNPLKDGRLPEWLEATQILHDTIGDEVFVMGRADQGPFDLACLLRGASQFMVDLLEGDPDEVAELLEYCSKATTVFAKAQKDFGADATSMGEAYAGPNLISPKMYREIALGFHKRVIREVQAYGIPMSLHICGNSNEIVEDMASSGAKILEVDWKVDMKNAMNHASGKAVLMGNIDPSDPLVWGTPQKVEKQVKEIIQATGGIGLFLSSGCAMGYNTPDENLNAMILAAKKYGNKEYIEDNELNI